MFDQNPLLHKLTIDDLAREHQDELKRLREHRGQRNFSSVATTVTVIMAAIFVIGSNVA